MALEPITRQEQIIAGKDLEPITRMEKFLKKYGGSGGSGGVSPEEVTTIVKDQFPGGVGYAKNDPGVIYWDGKDTEGREVFEIEGSKFYKLADYFPLSADFSELEYFRVKQIKNGKIITNGCYTAGEVENIFQSLDGMGWGALLYGIIASNGTLQLTEDAVFPSGIWGSAFGEGTDGSFVAIALEPIVETIDEKYLPKHTRHLTLEIIKDADKTSGGYHINIPRPVWRNAVRKGYTISAKFDGSLLGFLGVDGLHDTGDARYLWFSWFDATDALNTVQRYFKVNGGNITNDEYAADITPVMLYDTLEL